MAWASAEPHLQARSAGIDAHGFANHVLRVFGVLVQIGNDFLERDRGVIGMPAIVIRDHRHGRVADFRFARELALR